MPERIDDREHFSDKMFTGACVSSICLFPCDSSLPDEEIRLRLIQLIGKRERNERETIGGGGYDDIDRDVLVASVHDSRGGRILSRFAFERRLAHLNIEIRTSSPQPQVLTLRTVFARCTITRYAGNWAALSVSVTMATRGADARNYDAALVTDSAGRYCSALTGDQLIGLIRALSGLIRNESCPLSALMNIGSNCNSLSIALGGGPSGGSNACQRCADGQMTVVWGVAPDAVGLDSRTIDARQVSERLRYLLPGVVTRDAGWKSRSITQAREGLGVHVGPSNMTARVCGDHLVILTISDEERQHDNIKLRSTYPAPLRALEYALYQNMLIVQAEREVTKLERVAEAAIRNTSAEIREEPRTSQLRRLLSDITLAHADVLLNCEAHFKPWIFKYKLEQDIVKTVLEQTSAEAQLNSIRTRLESLNTLADEAHSMAAGQQFAEQQAQLVEIQNTNLASTKSLGWINALIAFTAAINLLSFIVALNIERGFATNVSSFLREIGLITFVFILGSFILFTISVLVARTLGNITVFAWTFFRKLLRFRVKKSDRANQVSNTDVYEALSPSKIVTIPAEESKARVN